MQMLCCLTWAGMEGVWQEVESQLAGRLRLIEQLSSQLVHVEEQRADKVEI